MARDIGLAIKLKRVEKGVTLEELAKNAELSITTLSHVENGKVHPNFKTILKICEVLGVSTKELFNDK